MLCACLIWLAFMIRFAIDRIRDNSWDHQIHWVEMIRYIVIAIVIVVMAYPEGLPMAVTLSIVHQMQRMKANEIYVRNIEVN